MRDRANGCVYMATHNAVSDVDDGVDTQVDIATVLDVHANCCRVISDTASVCMRDTPVEAVEIAVNANTTCN